jgi:hypothetical protein
MSLASLKEKMVGTEAVEDRDTLGGAVLDGNIYDMRLEVAYSQKSSSGALGFFTVWVTSQGRKVTDRQYITSGDAKGNKPYYEKDGKKLPLPGFSHVDFMVSLLTGKNLIDLDEQQSTIKLYNAAQGKEAPTEVTTYPELRGLPCKVGIKQIRQNKQVKVGNGYQASNEEQIVNEISKYFDSETSKTSTELLAKTDANFITKWSEKFANQLVDTYKPVAGATQSGSNPFAAQSKAAGGEGLKPSSMFGDAAAAAAVSGSMFGDKTVDTDPDAPSTAVPEEPNH